MTTSTAASESRSRRRPPGSRRRGFTLIEVMVAGGLASMILAAVLSSLIFISRASLATVDYAGMDREAREGLEKFAREVRMSDQVSSFSNDGVTLRVLTSSGSYGVTYTYVPADGIFYRNYGLSSQEALIKGITIFHLYRYTILQTAATNDLETKQLQLELRAERTGPARAFASNNVVSARYILRNKVVSN